MNIHLKIKDIRNQKNFGQSYMAEKMDISVVSYSSIERGVTELTVKRLYEISKILGVSINELLGEPTQNISDERVKELEKRVLELEKWLSDKDKLNQRLEQSLMEEGEHREMDMARIVSNTILKVAYKNKVGVVVEMDDLFDEKGEFIESISTPTPLIDYKPHEIIGFGVFLRLTEQEQKIVLKNIVSDRFYWGIISDFIGRSEQLQARVEYDFFASDGSFDYILNGLKEYKKYYDTHVFNNKKSSRFPFFDKNGEIIKYDYNVY
jgi:transcriptional regulator with XRE-family HTH domain